MYLKMFFKRLVWFASIVAFIFILYDVYVIYAFSHTNKSYQPDKPVNVPQNAHWYGGSDGGVWIELNNTALPGHHFAKIYTDIGDNWMSGVFVMSGDCKNTNFDANSLCKIIDGFDGRKIILENNGLGCCMIMQKK